jgi:hypothetical protein
LSDCARAGATPDTEEVRHSGRAKRDPESNAVLVALGSGLLLRGVPEDEPG